MKIAIIGYGKMGRAIERIARERGHDIVCVIDAGDEARFDSPEFKSADVSIEFSVPSAARDNVERSLRAGVKTLSGTTGWSEALPQMQALATELGGTLMWSSNYSLGVNLFRLINMYAAKLLSRFAQYTPSMTEVHHVHKLDHPSGTAKTLAEDLMSCDPAITGWTEDEVDTSSTLLHIGHERRGEVPGIHTVEWDSQYDTITLTHSAKTRDSFALGAVMAAEWLSDRTGVVTVDDMLNNLK